MPVFVDITGNKYNRLTAVEHKGGRKWLFRCDCGEQVITSGADVRNGKTKSCGCYNREALVARNTTHGKTNHFMFGAWRDLKQRCYNPKNEAYPNYGGRGITVCDRWLESFENFLADMGERPEGKSIDRIDNDKGYEPSNCRWATRVEQANNTRRNTYIEVDGLILLKKGWAEKMGISIYTINKRLDRGWPPHLAVTKPASEGVSQWA